PHNPADEIFNMLSINKPAVAAQMTHLSASPPENVYDTKLTGREIEILRLLAVNKSDDEIAYIFQISKDWVNAHITNIIDKLQVKDRSEAAVKARLDGILETKVYL
ncbi:MAG: helix-turn-helix transcriptional regulator, partial [Cyanobacteria bacterium]|nr:helix-turn-helix transcriptional regulator [Cyanobacteriota bacterium]